MQNRELKHDLVTASTYMFAYTRLSDIIDLFNTAGLPRAEMQVKGRAQGRLPIGRDGVDDFGPEALSGCVPYTNETMEEALDKAFWCEPGTRTWRDSLDILSPPIRRLSLHCVVSVGHQQGLACTPLPRSLAAAAGERMRLDPFMYAKPNGSRSRVSSGGAAQGVEE
jgi:hypothetical protein